MRPDPVMPADVITTILGHPLDGAHPNGSSGFVAAAAAGARAAAARSREVAVHEHAIHLQERAALLWVGLDQPVLAQRARDRAEAARRRLAHAVDDRVDVPNGRPRQDGLWFRTVQLGDGQSVS